MAKKLSVIINGKEFVSKATKEAEKGIKNMSNTADIKSKAMIASATAVKVAFAGIAAAIGGLALLTGKALKEAADMETVSTSFNVLIGDVEKAKKTIADLRSFAAKTPLQFNDITKAAQNLMAFGSEAEEVRDQISMLGDLSMGQADKLESIVRAYGKIQAKGKATMEELNMVTEAGVPILGALADMYGVTTEEVLKLVEQGKVGFGDIDQAFKNMTSSGGRFYGMLEKQSQTFNGLLSTLKDNISLILTRFGEAVLPQAVDMLEGVLGALDKFIKSGALDNLATRVAIFAAQTYNVMKNLGTLIEAIFLDVHDWMDRLFTLDWLRDRIQAALQPKWKDDGLWAGNSGLNLPSKRSSNLDKAILEITAQNEQLAKDILDMMKPAVPPELVNPDANPKPTTSPASPGRYPSSKTSFGMPKDMRVLDGTGSFASGFTTKDMAVGFNGSQFQFPQGGGEQRKGLGQQASDMYQTSGLATLLNEPMLAFQGLADTVIPLISSFTSVNALLNPLQTIFGAMMEVLQPVVDSVLSPLVGILKTIGKLIGGVLAPVIELLIPPIEFVAQAFVWLYNGVLRPVGNGIITAFNALFNVLAGLYNGFASAVNWALGWLGVEVKKLDYKSATTGHMKAIDTAMLSEAGSTSGSSYTGGGTGSSTSVQSVNITVYQTFQGHVIGDGGLESVGEFVVSAIRAYAGVGGTVKVIA